MSLLYSLLIKMIKLILFPIYWDQSEVPEMS